VVPLNSSLGTVTNSKGLQADSTPFTAALILVPTRELADQVFKAIEQFSAFCAKEIQATKLTDNVSDAVQRSLLSNVPDIVVSTPARVWHSINSSGLSLDKLQYLVLDEADLVLSYGYDEDMENISQALPKGVQTIMMSATLSAELDTLKGIFCRNPKLLDLNEDMGDEDEKLSQFFVKYATLVQSVVLLSLANNIQVRRGRQVVDCLPYLQTSTDQGEITHLRC